MPERLDCRERSRYEWELRSPKRIWKSMSYIRTLIGRPYEIPLDQVYNAYEVRGDLFPAQNGPSTT